MKSTAPFLILLALLILSVSAATPLSAFADASKNEYIPYYCTAGNPFADGISNKDSFFIHSDNTVTGVFEGKSFSFISTGVYDRTTKTMTYFSLPLQIKAELEVPGPYGNLQDATSGKLTTPAGSKILNCYVGL